MKFLIFESCLEKLLKICPATEFAKSCIGTNFIIKMSSHEGHDVLWQSQPIIKNLAAEYFLFPGAIFFLVVPLQNLIHLVNFLNISFCQNLNFLVLVVIFYFPPFTLLTQSIQKILRATSVENHLNQQGMGDRWPGFSAKYLHIFINGNSHTNLIVDFTQVQVMQTKSSSGMENAVRQQALESRLDIVTPTTYRYVLCTD